MFNKNFLIYLQFMNRSLQNTSQDLFFEILRKLIGENKFEYKFLYANLVEIFNGNKAVESFVINEINNEKWILVIHTNDLLIYGENWNSEQVKEISDAIPFNNFRNFHFSGTKKLIEDLLIYNEIQEFEIFKNRYFYRCNNLNSFDSKIVYLQRATNKDIPELALMLKNYYSEEYNGKNEKKITEMTEKISEYIENDSIYVLKKDEIIIAFQTINKIDIGILFTKEEYRNQGYGKFLLGTITENMLNNNSIVYLMTDSTKISSNKIVCKLGYEKYYDYSDLIINGR